MFEHIVNRSINPGEWNEKKGVSRDYFLTNPVRDDLNYMIEDTGLRINVMVWEEEYSPTEISLISGDGRTIGFKKFKSYKIYTKENDRIQEEIGKLIQYALENDLKNNKDV